MLRQLIDRVLRLKAEQDTISGDIKEVYAEAKDNGFDKTVMGQVVSRLRKEAKDGVDRVDAVDSLIELYLASYRGSADPTPHARARVPDESKVVKPPHDPTTGEILEPQAAPLTAPAQAGLAEQTPSTEGDAGLTAALAGPAEPITVRHEFPPPTGAGEMPEFLRRGKVAA